MVVVIATVSLELQKTGNNLLALILQSPLTGPEYNVIIVLYII